MASDHYTNDWLFLPLSFKNDILVSPSKKLGGRGRTYTATWSINETL